MTDSSDQNNQDSQTLSFPFRGQAITVTHVSSVSLEQAKMAIGSVLFRSWYQRCEQSMKQQQDGKSQHIDIHGVEIQSVDVFGARGVGFIKIKADCTLTDGKGETVRLPGICFLRGNAVAILVALFCDDDNHNHDESSAYALLVEQPRVPIGSVSCLELPAGMMDDEKQNVTGIAVQEIREECGIDIRPRELVDLSDLALQTPLKQGNLPMAAVPPSPGGCDEFCRFMYLEKRVSKTELDTMRGRLQGLRDHGEHITLRVVPLEEAWSISGDAKCMIAMFLVDKLRKQQQLASAGGIATPLMPEPCLVANNGVSIPQLAFGLYKIPADEHGVEILLNAIRAGYRHFDGAAYYQNEHILGRALHKSGLPREAFYITTKVWNDSLKGGRQAVRESVRKSLANLDFGDYFDLVLVHWPVPGYFVEGYKALEEEYQAGSIRALGLSNFNEQEYEELEASGIQVHPACNQFEVSPAMYRPELIEYFTKRQILVSASKSLNRAAVMDNPVLTHLSESYQVTPAQIMLQWAIQKGLLLASKTSSLSRMQENRSFVG